MLHSNNSGRTMLETLTVLTLIALLTILGLKGFQTAKSRHQASSALHDASAIATRLLVAKDQSKVKYSSEKEFLKTSIISVVDYGETYESVGIKANFQSDLDTCKHFQIIATDRTDFAVSQNTCREGAAVVCLVPQSPEGKLKYNKKTTTLTALDVANTLCE